jgi:hypothetical protein
MTEPAQNTDVEQKSSIPNSFVIVVGDFSYTITYREQNDLKIVATHKDMKWKESFAKFSFGANFLCLKMREVYEMLYEHSKGCKSDYIEIKYQNKIIMQDIPIGIEIVFTYPVNKNYRDSKLMVLQPVPVEQKPDIMNEMCQFLQQRGHTCQQVIVVGTNDKKFVWCEKNKCSKTEHQT